MSYCFSFFEEKNTFTRKNISHPLKVASAWVKKHIHLCYTVSTLPERMAPSWFLGLSNKSNPTWDSRLGSFCWVEKIGCWASSQSFWKIGRYFCLSLLRMFFKKKRRWDCKHLPFWTKYSKHQLIRKIDMINYNSQYDQYDNTNMINLFFDKLQNSIFVKISFKHCQNTPNNRCFVVAIFSSHRMSLL